MKKTTTACLVLFMLMTAVVFYACKKSAAVRYGQPTPIPFTVPDGFPAPVYDFTRNPLTEEGFALGRRLFHDNRISTHSDVTCGSCHQQHAGYTTFDHDLGHGTGFQHTTRNVPGIFNMVWHREFEWDGRITGLDKQTLTCLSAPEKMGGGIDVVIRQLNNLPEYAPLFGRAFGDEQITEERVGRALAQFVGSLVSANSKYDKVKKGEATFNDSEQNGYLIFQQKCASCHAEPLFTDLSYRNIGLGANPFQTDHGRMQVTGNPADSMKFKVPSLRNVMLTSYYAHDGRYMAVSEILDHYSDGTMQGPTLDPLVQNNIPLTELEKFYLREFFFTLDDDELISDPRFDVP